MTNRLSSTRRTHMLIRQKEEEVQEELQEVHSTLQVKHPNRTKNGRFPSKGCQGRVSST